MATGIAKVVDLFSMSGRRQSQTCCTFNENTSTYVSTALLYAYTQRLYSDLTHVVRETHQGP